MYVLLAASQTSALFSLACVPLVSSFFFRFPSFPLHTPCRKCRLITIVTDAEEDACVASMLVCNHIDRFFISLQDGNKKNLGNVNRYVRGRDLRSLFERVGRLRDFDLFVNICRSYNLASSHTFCFSCRRTLASLSMM